MKLFVAGITYRTTEDDLRRMFEKYGNVTEASLATDRETGKSRGFGFVTMPDRKQADMAIETMNDAELDGRRLKVNEARPKADRGAGRREERQGRRG